MMSRPQPEPCRGFQVEFSFPDVDPAELAREAAAEGSRARVELEMLRRQAIAAGDIRRVRLFAQALAAAGRGL
ncbi:MAG: hypothetical protein J0I21_05695 [Alphaproteobacteria bacterium]|nr:hypothetical protein [Alphaproteobacteria bacterium]